MHSYYFEFELSNNCQNKFHPSSVVHRTATAIATNTGEGFLVLMKNYLNKEPNNDSYAEFYDLFNNAPFDVNEFYDLKTTLGRQQSLNILILNSHIQNLSEKNKSDITKELFDQALHKWIKEEILLFNEETINFLRERLLALSSHFYNSENKFKKNILLKHRDKIQQKLKNLDRHLTQHSELRLKESFEEKKLKYLRHLMSVSAKGKNPKFLLEETLNIHLIRYKTGLTFEHVCLLIAKTYEFFYLLPSNTNAINYSHSLKTNIYQFIKRKKDWIIEFLEHEKKTFSKDYQANQIEIDVIIEWINSVIN